MVTLLIAAGVTAALGFILAIVALVLVIMAPSFDEFGQINECAGCPLDDCRACRFNPEYWDGTKYIGPSRRELVRMRKEIANEQM